MAEARDVFVALDRRKRRRLLLGTAVRTLLATASLLAVYFVVPLGDDAERSAAALGVLAVGLAGFTVVLYRQVRRILDAPMPGLRAVESLALVIPLFTVVFALVYVVMATAEPGSFDEPISRMDALYFTVTVLSTTGFGDITAQTDLARAVVTLQMVLDLILIGLVARLLLGASKIGAERRRAERSTGTAPSAPPGERPPLGSS
jgi:hypothetical protein